MASFKIVWIINTKQQKADHMHKLELSMALALLFFLLACLGLWEMGHPCNGCNNSISTWHGRVTMEGDLPAAPSLLMQQLLIILICFCHPFCLSTEFKRLSISYANIQKLGSQSHIHILHNKIGIIILFHLPLKLSLRIKNRKTEKNLQ